MTGGIGSGKSTVARLLVERGAVVIDADKLAREVLEPGTDGLKEVVRAFGEDVLNADGTLDRAALAAKAFASEEARQTLNGITHPRIGALTGQRMSEAAEDAIVVHDIPLLVERDMAAMYHLVIVVYADSATRLGRLVGSRGMDRQDAENRIAAQATDEQRRAVADVWLDNSGEVPDVTTLWDRLVGFEKNLRNGAYASGSPIVVPYDGRWPAQARRIARRISMAAAWAARRAHRVHGGAWARGQGRARLPVGRRGHGDRGRPAGSVGAGRVPVRRAVRGHAAWRG